MLTTLRANAWKYSAIALGLGLGFALLMQTIRLADAKLEAAHAETTMQTERAATAQAALKNSERYRKLEGTHRDQIAKIDNDAQAALAAVAAGRARADVARNRLQRELAEYITQHREAAQARAAAGQCAPDPAPSICLPTCTDALTSERENSRQLLTKPEPVAPPASAPTTKPAP